MADPAPQWLPPPPAPPPVPGPPSTAPPPTGWSPSTTPTRRPWWRSKWGIAGIVIGAVLAVGIATGNVGFSFFTFSEDASPSAVIPVDNVPQVGTPDDHGHIEGPQVSFDYPAHWHVLREPGMAVTGAPTGLTLVGIATENHVAVETMRLTRAFSRANFKDFSDHMDQVVRDQVGASGWGVVKGPTQKALGGLPAVGYVLTGPGPDGAIVTERVVFTARGTTEFWLACDSTQAHRAAIAKGCDQILRTFRIGSG